MGWGRAGCLPRVPGGGGGAWCLCKLHAFDCYYATALQYAACTASASISVVRPVHLTDWLPATACYCLAARLLYVQCVRAEWRPSYPLHRLHWVRLGRMPLPRLGWQLGRTAFMHYSPCSTTCTSPRYAGVWAPLRAASPGAWWCVVWQGRVGCKAASALGLVFRATQPAPSGLGFRATQPAPCTAAPCIAGWAG